MAPRTAANTVAHYLLRWAWSWATLVAGVCGVVTLGAWQTDLDEWVFGHYLTHCDRLGFLP